MTDPKPTPTAEEMIKLWRSAAEKWVNGYDNDLPDVCVMYGIGNSLATALDDAVRERDALRERVRELEEQLEEHWQTAMERSERD